MALIDELNQDIKQAMKAKDKTALSVLRMLKGSVQNEEINEGGTLTEDQEMTVLSRELKQRKDSISEFRAAGREDLAEKTEAELGYVEKYLPKQLSRDEIEAVVKDVIQDTNAQSKADFGKVMGQAVARMKGQAAGSEIQQVVKELLK
ncbi:GatB/YqeY domain-containing protein [Aerococcus sanguinicola]|uniref:Aspartyl-tRNA amidotransferase n=1 Tax=Aerococcus sanguinicola TaxID=119206 RepID=A0A109RE10_9LACT|nr:GatB/YqeY domain-containing protein [Aerococcus sanguinicola]AMB94836.1 aspartyl-tRNA amidotransferase [Aerococcus sanguinicola]MDK7049609.1 GatB/YqeY domain-containing protein [Aerococcus sanguinicola]PKZ23161.1 GatB/YqeY domain-containing protein [Aerococcus sanguinicola]